MIPILAHGGSITGDELIFIGVSIGFTVLLIIGLVKSRGFAPEINENAENNESE